MQRMFAPGKVATAGFHVRLLTVLSLKIFYQWPVSFIKRKMVVSSEPRLKISDCQKRPRDVANS
jgi:hypothetical protein